MIVTGIYAGSQKIFKVYHGTRLLVDFRKSVSAYADSQSDANVKTILWYPPVGDEVLLAATDGIDVTMNGDILEIRQVYQATIDDENGILEVI